MCLIRHAVTTRHGSNPRQLLIDWPTDAPLDATHEIPSHYRRVWLFLITQQFSLRVPDLQAVAVDYVMIWTQRFGGFERQFERLKRLHGMAAVSRDAKRSV